MKTPLGRLASLVVILLAILFIFRSPYISELLRVADGGYVYKLYLIISDFIKESTRDFFVFCVLVLFLEWVRGETFSLTDRDLARISNQISRELDCIDVDTAIKNSFQRRFGTEDAPSIEEVYFSKPPYSGVKIHITLRDSPAEESEALYSVRTTIKAGEGEFVLAIARSRAVQDRLVNFASISDVQVIPNVLKDKSAMQTISERISIGCVPFRRLALEKIPEKLFSRYVPGLEDVPEVDFTLLRCDVPADEDTRFYYELKEFPISKHDHYLYWAADRAMFLDEISVDASGMSYFGKIHYSFATNIQGYSSEDNDKIVNGGKYTVRCYRWITFGQGINLSWRSLDAVAPSHNQQ